MVHLPEQVRKRVENHPCYSEEAHHHFARMHVAVAPACNVQCHYCNRKYDCANESRPGVVSELLTPEQAVKKALAIAAHVPEMTVLGIAGPGDALANPERTFETFRLLAEKAPDIRLCVSTNGLALPEHVEALSKHHVDHLTITINCVDPAVGAKIYPWVFWNHRRVKGENAARILIEQQQRGLEMAVDKGILVKVNSVMIPGVNDEHLREVSRVVKEKGAFLHNVMPLIAEPQHGTFYGVMGQRGPTHVELQALQDACSGDMTMMRHCRQCRSDAVGLLGEDRSAEFTMEQIDRMEIDHEAAVQRRAEVHARIDSERKARREATRNAVVARSEIQRPGARIRSALIAVASVGGGVINQHFGHATEFLIYEATSEAVRFVGHRPVERYCLGADTCGDAESALENSIRALEGCEAVLCSKVGYEPWGALEAAGIQPNGEHAMEPIESAVAAVYEEMVDAGLLTELAEVALAQA